MSITVQRSYALRPAPWRWLAEFLAAPVRASTSASRYVRITVLPPDYPPIAEKTVEVAQSGPITLQFQARVPVGTGYTVAATEFEPAWDPSYEKTVLSFGKVSGITVQSDETATVTVTLDTINYSIKDYDRTCTWDYRNPCFTGRVSISPGFKIGGVHALDDPASEGLAVVYHSAADGRTPTILDFWGSSAGGAPDQPITLRFRLAVEVYESRDTNNSDPAMLIIPAPDADPIEVTVNPPGGVIGN